MYNKEKTLVIILAETRAWEKTFDNFKTNVLKPLNSDLCLCIGIKNDYDYNNSFYKEAKYSFLYNEPDDWADAFNYAELNIKNIKYNINIENIEDTQKKPPYIEDLQKTPTHIENIKYINYTNKNSIWGKIQKWDESTDNIDYLGRFPNEQSILEDKHIFLKNYEEIVYHTPQFIFTEWRYCAYGIKKKYIENTDNIILQYGINTIRPLNKNNNIFGSWKRFLQIKEQFLGGIKDHYNEHKGSAAILIFFRWFLFKKLEETGIINNYDRFIITRSDYIWRLEHPSLSILTNDKIWIPNCETYEGITDRHAVIPKQYMKQYCNILTNMIDENSNNYFNKMKNISEIKVFNLEKLILFHLNEYKINYNFFPYIMFTIRPNNVNTRWMAGTIYNEKEGYYIKYISEDVCSQNYVNDFILWKNKNKGDLTDYYKEIIPCDIKYYY